MIMMVCVFLNREVTKNLPIFTHFSIFNHFSQNKFTFFTYLAIKLLFILFTLHLRV